MNNERNDYLSEENKPVLKLTLELPLSINKIYKKSNFGIYMTAEGKAYKEKMIEHVAMEALHQNWTKVEDRYLYLDEVVYMNKKGRDSDNLKKLTQDVITESNAVWKDDTYCLARTNRIYIDKNNPRIEISISCVDFIGIFDNESKLTEFKLNYCDKCSRGKTNCKIIKEALENRITEDIVDSKCLGFKEIKVRKK